MAFSEKAVWAKKLRVTGSVSGSRRTVNLFGQNITYRQKIVVALVTTVQYSQNNISINNILSTNFRR